MSTVVRAQTSQHTANLFSSFSNNSFCFSFHERYLDIFINAYVDTHQFVLVVHPGDDTKCRTKSSQMGRKIYKLLKERQVMKLSRVSMCFSDSLTGHRPTGRLS